MSNFNPENNQNSSSPEVVLQTTQGEMLLDYENTMIMLFGNPMLNHIYWQQGGRCMALFNHQELMDNLHEKGFPTYTRTDNPEWAIQRLFELDDHGVDIE